MLLISIQIKLIIKVSDVISETEKPLEGVRSKEDKNSENKPVEVTESSQVNRNKSSVQKSKYSNL